MTLDQFRPVVAGALAPFVSAARALGVSPVGVSLVAFATAVLAAAAFAVATPLAYVAGAVLVFLNGWFDLVDGALAREEGSESRAGDLLDHALDRYADLLVLGGLSAGVGRYALGFVAVTGVLLTSYMGTQIQAVGLGREYGGLVGRADRLALICVAAVLAAVFPGADVAGVGPIVGVLAVLAVVGHLTALQRFYGAWSDLA